MGLLRIMMLPKLQLLAVVAFTVAMLFLENQIQKLEESRSKLGEGPSHSGLSGVGRDGAGEALQPEQVGVCLIPVLAPGLRGFREGESGSWDRGAGEHRLQQTGRMELELACWAREVTGQRLQGWSPRFAFLGRGREDQLRVAGASGGDRNTQVRVCCFTSRIESPGSVRNGLVVVVGRVLWRAGSDLGCGHLGAESGGTGGRGKAHDAQKWKETPGMRGSQRNAL
jgi:hypothetical protein